MPLAGRRYSPTESSRKKNIWAVGSAHRAIPTQRESRMWEAREGVEGATYQDSRMSIVHKIVEKSRGVRGHGTPGHPLIDCVDAVGKVNPY